MDHTHIVAAIPPKHAIAWVVKTLKGKSSHWINHDIRPPAYHFAWQRGYGCLTMGETQKEIALAYVHNQKAHHQQNTTNYWLEYCTELDEGPDDMKLPNSIDNTKLVREEKVVYDGTASLPF